MTRHIPTLTLSLLALALCLGLSSAQEANVTAGNAEATTNSTASTTSTSTATASGISDECRDETMTLQENSELNDALNNLLDSYLEDYEDTCDFGGVTEGNLPSCSWKFESANVTDSYQDMCRDVGGQVYERGVGLKCGSGIASFTLDLGDLPVCIGESCNATALEPDDLNITRIDEFIDELQFAGCKADFSGATGSNKMWNIVSTGSLAAMALWVANSLVV